MQTYRSRNSRPIACLILLVLCVGGGKPANYAAQTLSCARVGAVGECLGETCWG